MIKPKMINSCRTRHSIVLLFFVVFFLSSCAGKTDEDLILELMDKIGVYAEKKDIESIMTNLSKDGINGKQRR